MDVLSRGGDISLAKIFLGSVSSREYIGVESEPKIFSTWYKILLLLLNCIAKGSLSNNGGDPEDDAYLKMNLYFTSQIRNFLVLFTTPMAL